MDSIKSSNDLSGGPFAGIGGNGILNLVRKNIKNLVPYSSARHEFTGEASVFLDANENSYGSPLAQHYNRYPDPLQWQLKLQVTKIKGVPAENIFIGNGSDEVIDIAYTIKHTYKEKGLTF